jgi:hypothetical protein
MGGSQSDRDPRGTVMSTEECASQNCNYSYPVSTSPSITVPATHHIITTNSPYYASDAGSSIKIVFPEYPEYPDTRMASIAELRAAISGITGPLVTGEDVKLSAIHSFMNKHEYEVIDTTNRDKLLARVDQNFLHLFAAIISPLLNKYDIKVCKACGRVEVDVHDK